VKRYGIEAEPAVDADVEAAFDWYEGEERGLGFEFLEELRAAVGELKYVDRRDC
jgi:hypothetical protein